MESLFIELAPFYPAQAKPLLGLSFIFMTLPLLWIIVWPIELTLPWIGSPYKLSKTCYIVPILLCRFTSMHFKSLSTCLLRITAPLPFALILTLIGVAICHQILELRR